MEIFGEERGTRERVSRGVVRILMLDPDHGTTIREACARARQSEESRNFHRAEGGQGRYIGTCPGELILEKGAVKARVVGDYNTAGEPVKHLAEHVSEARRVHEVSAPDTVDLGGAEIAIRPEKRAPRVAALSIPIDGHQRQLHDPVMSARVETGRFTIGDDVGALIESHGDSKLP